MPTEKPPCTRLPAIVEQLENDEFVKLLSATTLFRGIPPATLPLSTLGQLSREARVIELPKNWEIPITADDPKEGFIFEIRSGFVKIYDRRRPPKSEQQKGVVRRRRALLAWRIPNELLGDFQFAFPEERLQDQYVTTDPCTLLRLPSTLVIELAQAYPQIYLNIAHNLAAKAIKARIRAQILRFPGIEPKLAKLFLEILAERKPDPTIPDKKVLCGTFHVEDLVDFLGYGKRRIEDGIKYLTDNGLIRHHGSLKSGKFEICNEGSLHQLIQSAMMKRGPKDSLLPNSSATAMRSDGSQP